jgi:hypothetical protein
MSRITPGLPSRRWLMVPLALLACGRDFSGDAQRIRKAARGPRPEAMWAIPRVAPCSVLSRSAVAAVIGDSVLDSRIGGTAVDGSACQYRGTGPFVVRLGLMSVNAYESLELDFGGDTVPDVGTGALVDGPDPLGDVTLVAKRGNTAILVQISGVIPGAVGQARRAMAASLARQALDRLP